MHGYVTVNYFLFRTNTSFMREIKGERVREKRRGQRERLSDVLHLRKILCV